MSFAWQEQAPRGRNKVKSTQCPLDSALPDRSASLRSGGYQAPLVVPSVPADPSLGPAPDPSAVPCRCHSGGGGQFPGHTQVGMTDLLGLSLSYLPHFPRGAYSWIGLQEGGKEALYGARFNHQQDGLEGRGFQSQPDVGRSHVCVGQVA